MLVASVLHGSVVSFCIFTVAFGPFLAEISVAELNGVGVLSYCR